MFVKSRAQIRLEATLTLFIFHSGMLVLRNFCKDMIAVKSLFSLVADVSDLG